MNRRPSFFKTLLVASILFFGGLMAYLYLTKPIAEEAKASKNWQTVEGVITKSKLNTSRDSDGKELYSANI